MYKKLFLCLLTICTITSHAQKGRQNGAIDSLVDYDLLFNELESFIDSITAPRSFGTFNIGATKEYFNYISTDGSSLEIRNTLLLSPSAGYYHKTGFGINSTTSVIQDNGRFNAYQLAATASYDYIKNRAFITGVSYTRFFNKDSLPFYTSPLNNGVSGFFSYRRWWVRPTLAVNYGWGSRTTLQESTQRVKLKKKGPPSQTTTTTQTVEKVSDLSFTASVKHDFYWLNVLAKKDHIRLTPQLAFTAGTQDYGFNQTNTSYVSNKASGTNVLFNTENVFVRNKTGFQPIALTASVRSEFSKGIFFIQPQLFVDYLFFTTDKKVMPFFAINAGIIL